MKTSALDITYNGYYNLGNGAVLARPEEMPACILSHWDGKDSPVVFWGVLFFHIGDCPATRLLSHKDVEKIFAYRRRVIYTRNDEGFITQPGGFTGLDILNILTGR